MRISDWSSDVCSSDLAGFAHAQDGDAGGVVRLSLLLVAATLAAAPLAAQEPHWVASWGSAQQVPEPHNALPDDALTDATLRQTVRLSLGGTRVRVRLSNTFGPAPLTTSAAAIPPPVARGQPPTPPATHMRLSFVGVAAVRHKAGADDFSDRGL